MANNPALAMWRKAVKQAGGYKKGEFVPIKGKLLADSRKSYAQLKKGK
jgi:hypothetical protein